MPNLNVKVPCGATTDDALEMVRLAVEGHNAAGVDPIDVDWMEIVEMGNAVEPHLNGGRRLRFSIKITLKFRRWTLVIEIG